MSDEGDKKASSRFSAWKKKGLDKVADAGGSSDVMRQALKVNPKLKGDKSTREFLDDVSKQRAVGEEKKRAEEQQPEKQKRSERKERPRVGKNAVETVKAVKAWLEGEDRRIAEELAAIDQELLAVADAVAKAKADAKTEIDSALKRIDPNRLSPMTKAVLRDERAFLEQIGLKP